MAVQELSLDVALHIKYWHRCLKNVLPTGYTSMDSSRMTLGFFILSALDLLGAGAETFPEDERANIKDWILKCQHPDGGFCGSPNHKYPDAAYVDVGHGKQTMDPANLPATYFAIMGLSFVGSLDGVRRDDCLRWIKGLQREDGSFGEFITQDGVIQGGTDMRISYAAMAIRWILKGDYDSSKEDGADIDVDQLVKYIRSGQTYDGGIGESSRHEAHAGYTYCAIASLKLANRLSKSKDSEPISGLTNVDSTIRWLVSRQTGYTTESDEEEEGDAEHAPAVKLQGIYTEEPAHEDEEFVGFNGRCNKRADTCYAFWVGAAINMLCQEKVELLDIPAIRRFLFEQTQHRIGGFGKCPGDPPDIYHSYLALAALATMKEPDLKPLDAALCVSIQQKEKIEQVRKAALV
ncbi:terpenoid cyclases/Protein prenyltransferase [Mollisia scopiformis]|uniref:Terpenoid cyclases/Protein prenyltransferase n=1 Tax=Mollisia scopiformis TaxID=149040 RepID=A0A194XRN1_MOLSC|nr:terpenoid cyclases/Protein prenyltransferase [Mollisia scopiformis]KUJ22387.1 terpenoid cyclases/Protein prenyltransferase [Mollisia scopiformis]